MVQLPLTRKDAIVEALVEEGPIGTSFGQPKGRLTEQPICIAGVVMCRGLQVAKGDVKSNSSLTASLLPCSHHVPQRQLLGQALGDTEHQVNMVWHNLVLHHLHLWVALRQFLYLMPYDLADGAELYSCLHGIPVYPSQQGLAVHRRHRDKVDARLVVVVPVAPF